ncbi:MAG: hypothetical protein K6E35_01505 [Bacteroidales bacterium]|nr:hypothetical protein [Bacteroidales bacterium]
MRHPAVLHLLSLLGAVLCLGSCGIYSFTGTSIQNDVNTVQIEPFEYKAQKVNPSLSSDLTEALRTRFRRMTRLEQVEQDGDLEIVGEVIGYETTPAALSAGDIAARSRLTVTVRISFTNKKYPEDDFENKNFSAYGEFDAAVSLDDVESELCQQIVETLIADIFNATVAQW